MIIKTSRTNLGMIVMILSMLLFCYYWRYNFGKIAANINILFYIGFFLFISAGFMIKTSLFLCIVIITFQSVFINLNNGINIETIAYTIILLYIPLLLHCILINKNEDSKLELCIRFTQIFNIFIYIIIGIYLFDLVFGNIIMSFIGKYIIPQMANWFSNQRYASYIGHSLVTSQLYIIFYLLNTIVNKYLGMKLVNTAALYIITCVGVLSTGSKTALILILFSFIWVNFQGKHRTRNIFLMIVLLLTLYALGGFNLVISRFLNEYSLTTGRNEAWKLVNRIDGLEIHFFTGVGEYYRRLVTNNFGVYITEVSLEYPFLVMLYKYGIFSTCVYVYVIVISPIIAALRKKNSLIAFSILVLFIQVNSFNGYGVLPDIGLLYNLLILVMTYINDVTAYNDVTLNTSIHTQVCFRYSE